MLNFKNAFLLNDGGVKPWRLTKIAGSNILTNTLSILRTRECKKRDAVYNGISRNLTALLEKGEKQENKLDLIQKQFPKECFVYVIQQTISLARPWALLIDLVGRASRKRIRT